MDSTRVIDIQNGMPPPEHLSFEEYQAAADAAGLNNGESFTDPFDLSRGMSVAKNAARQRRKRIGRVIAIAGVIFIGIRVLSALRART